MKSVSVRDFQLNANKYLQELPLLLTRYNIVVAQVLPNGSGIISEKQLDEVYKKVEGVKPVETPKDLGRCTFVSRSGLGVFPCRSPATIEREGGNVCEEHK